MNKQTTIEAGTLAQAMALAFAEIEGAKKNANNPHFKAKFASLGSVMDAIKPALTNHGLFFTQASHVAEDGVCVETIIHHSSGEQVSCGKLYVPANKRDAQGFGSALTYARRYGLMTAFGVPAEDDDGNAAAQSYRQSGPPANGNGHAAKQAEARDAPFPQGPCKNKTALKDAGRALWADVMSCADEDTLTALLASHEPLIAQLKEGLPQWWGGGSKDGEAYEGLGQVIERLQRDFAGLVETGMDWRANPVSAG